MIESFEDCLSSWRGISAQMAAKKLILLGYAHVYLTWDHSEHTPSDLVLSDRVENMLARDVGPFQFVGGPPGAYKVYYGTLFMLLVDRLMHDQVTSK